MTLLTDPIEGFDQLRPELESTHRNQWVLFHQGRFIGAFPDFDSAAVSAEERFNGGACLIGQLGALPIPLPRGAMLSIAHSLQADADPAA